MTSGQLSRVIARPIPPLTEAQIVKFWAHVEKAATCWKWRGYTSRGYGKFRVGQREFLAHRVAWVLTTSEQIPQGLQLDHLCRNRACVNPTHLEVVTQRENTLRGENSAAIYAKRTHCAEGHPLSGENLVVEFKGGRHSRYCRICKHRAARAWWASRKSQRQPSIPVDARIVGLLSRLLAEGASQ